ncbi:hypothetical protein Sjap_007345 [Stephania japonica]|uniref:Heparan-alpha-glucosaminide N-acetyltransferase catalytic domain-containing protein n=1 Tax=Stephania japonica TaxID=461633 RepID=A0AAP0PDG6_9MAGN
MSSPSAAIVTDEEERNPLLQPNQSSPHYGVSIAEEDESKHASQSQSSPTTKQPDRPNSSPTKSSQRLVSLDVFRGLTVAFMILVDDAGGAFPSINHSPWFGVTLADFVMPFFLFGVGVSVGLVFKTPSSKLDATKKVILRTIKLFVLGLVLQGGYFHGRGDLTYGVDVDRIRWFGILQRISIGYLLAAVSEIWLVPNTLVHSAITFIKKYYIQWMVAILICLTYIGLLYLLYVPNWEFEVSNTTSSLLVPKYGSSAQIVVCGVRGSMEPPCNAVGFIDRFLLGEKHLYQRPVYRRTKECSVNSPDYGPLPPNSPAWCVAPFDPEGVLSDMFRGIALWACNCTVEEPLTEDILVAHLFVANTAIWFSSHGISWSPIPLSGVPLSKPLYTLSYMCITAGASGMVLIIIYYVVDVIHFRKPTILFQWMGMNALIVYALAAAELLPAAIQGFYWRSPANNLVNGTESLLQTLFHSKRWGTLDTLLFSNYITKVDMICTSTTPISNSSWFTAFFRRKMNSENAYVEATVDTCIGSHGTVAQRKSSEFESTSQSHLDRAVAQRALYGSSRRRRIGSRKAKDNELMRLSPSRLSRVSSIDGAAD